jgi:hypothetical protein
MTQCTLRQADARQVAWIDSRAAVVGNRVELLETSDIWDVVEVANNVQFPYHVVNDRSRDYLRTRKASDI